MEDKIQITIYRNKRISVWQEFNGAYYASIGPIEGEEESYISRSETAEEALLAAKAAVGSESIVLA